MARVPDPLYIAAGRLSVAVRSGDPAEVILRLRRELAGAQLERFVARLLEAGTPPTPEQSRNICKVIKDAALAAEAA
jgi:hypothetical protein